MLTVFIQILMAMIVAALAAAIVVGVMLELLIVETVFLYWPYLIGMFAAWIAVLMLGMFLPYGWWTVLSVLLAVWGAYWLIGRTRMPWKV